MTSCSGVRQKGGPVVPPRGTDPNAVWPFAPAQLVLHPLTRIVRTGEAGERAIEAHVELRDAWGDACKGVGILRFEVGRDADSGLGDNAPVVADPSTLRWEELDLTDPDVNSGHYNQHATLTYRFVLALPSGAGEHQRIRLRAEFFTPDGRTLSDAMTIEP